MKLTTSIILDMRRISGLSLQECKHYLIITNNECIQSEEEWLDITIKRYLSGK